MTYIEVDNPTHADLHLSPVLLSRSRNGFSYVVNKPVIPMSAHFCNRLHPRMEYRLFDFKNAADVSDRDTGQQSIGSSF